MEKKYWYFIQNNCNPLCDNSSYGWVKLTEAEAKIIAYATDPRNWKGGYISDEIEDMIDLSEKKDHLYDCNGNILEE